MNFLSEDAPKRGVAVPVAPGIRRVVADNPGPMTYRGTNTYLIDWEGGIAVLDPGPDDASHIGHLLDLSGAPVRALILTHAHNDHAGALPGLRAATGAALHAWAGSRVMPDVGLVDGDEVGPWRAVHTPGHAPDHLCFAGPNGIVFSGDHVMSWSSTVVGGDGGDMAAYFHSLERLLTLDSALYLPGHGPPLPEPVRFTRALLEHRRAREQAILTILDRGPASTETLVAAIYPDLAASLMRAATANVIAHVQKLVGDGRATPSGTGWTRTPQP